MQRWRVRDLTHLTWHSPKSCLNLPFLFYLSRMKWLCLVAFMYFHLTCVGQDTLFMPLLGREIWLVKHHGVNNGALLYNMHDNENTSASAGRIISNKVGGEMGELVHCGIRTLSFKYAGDSIHIDPNRIYTDQGVWNQLRFNRRPDTTLFRKICEWRNELLDILSLDEYDIVIALHNNTNKNYSYSSYMPGQAYDNEAASLYPGHGGDVDDFFFVTDTLSRDLLHGGRFRVIMQNNEEMTDDGSLSVYCAQHGIRYVNVEAQHGHLFRQIQMLHYLYRKFGLLRSPG